MEQWLLHDELFYQYRYEVLVPRLNSNANRAAFRRIPESDLRLADRVENDVWLTWHRPESRLPKEWHVRQGCDSGAMLPQRHWV